MECYTFRVGCLAVLGLVATACATRPPITRLPEPEAPAGAPAAAAPTALRMNLDGASRRYEVESGTAVYAAADTATVLDSISIRAVLAFSAEKRADGSLALRGQVQQMTVTSGLAARREVRALDSPYTLAWTISSAGVVRDDSAAPQCDDIEQTARDLLLPMLPLLPDSIAGAAPWRAESRVMSCRGGLSYDVQSAGSVTPLNFEEALAGSGALSLESRSSVTISGRGVQGTTEMTLRGGGTVVTLYTLEPRPTRLRSSSTSSTLRLEFDLGYRTERLVQRTTRKVTAID